MIIPMHHSLASRRVLSELPLQVMSTETKGSEQTENDDHVCI